MTGVVMEDVDEAEFKEEEIDTPTALRVGVAVEVLVEAGAGNMRV
jgi:hypothetical protein